MTAIPRRSPCHRARHGHARAFSSVARFRPSSTVYACRFYLLAGQADGGSFRTHPRSSTPVVSKSVRKIDPHRRHTKIKGLRPAMLGQTPPGLVKQVAVVAFKWFNETALKTAGERPERCLLSRHQHCVDLA